jgi:cytochrome c biogenesis protein CcmG, thiol:disulfide interchange protein DsbE
MTVIKLPLLIIFFALVQISACSSNEVSLVKGKPAPSFNLKNLQQRSVNFPDEFSGKVVLISFWADWCPSCKKELRDFEELYQKHRGQGLAVLALNIDQDKKTAMSFIADLNLSYEILLDDKGDVAKRYATTSLPSALIVDKAGNLHTRMLGETPSEVFEQIITSLL